MLLDFLFQIWRRFSGPLQWWSLWLVNSKFMVSVSGVVFDRHGNVLLQRHRHWVPDVWGLPGGIVQSGESLENALAREVFEETGLVISEIELVRLISGYKIRLEGYYRANLAEYGPAQTMKLQEQEVIEARFFPLDQLPANILPLQRELIDMAARRYHNTITWASPYKFFTIGILILYALGISACSSLGQARAATATARLVPTPGRISPPTATVPMKVVTLKPIIPSPTVPTASQSAASDTAIKNFQALLADYRQKLKTTGWIHSKYTFSFSPNGQGIEVPPQIVEKWLRFDDTGLLVEAYDFNSSPEGKDMGGMAVRNGQVDLIFYDGSVQHSTDETPSTINDLTNYYEAYLQKANGSPLSQDATVFNGINAWKFSYHFQAGGSEILEAIYFDKDTGLILASCGL